jgi:peptidoglycan hydrolase-like protein with peptidoglycan-binding domain
MYPSGYGLDELPLDELVDLHWPVERVEPEFRRRAKHFLKSKNGLIGIGDILPRGDSNVSAASANNRSFHQLQRYEDGRRWAAASDLVVRRALGLGHSSGLVPWHEVPVQGSPYAAEWGVHMNVAGEPWHIQCVEMDGYGRWDRGGRRRPDPGFTLPCFTPEEELPLYAGITFDPWNDKMGLWPVNPAKPLLSVRGYAEIQRTEADNRCVWTGDAVSYLQGFLTHHFLEDALKIDGWFGNKTERALAAWQGSQKLWMDGLCGPVTWGVLDGHYV